MSKKWDEKGVTRDGIEFMTIIKYLSIIILVSLLGYSIYSLIIFLI